MKRAMLIFAVLSAAVWLSSCSTYRNTFKLTIEVEVDGERKIASSVYEREIYDNIGGVADRIRGTMPHMSLGQHGDIILSFRWFDAEFSGNIEPERPIYVDGSFTWYFPPFDQGQKQPNRAVLYPSSGAVVVPVGKLLSLPVFWRPPRVTEITQFKKIWFHNLEEFIGPAVRPVRITIEPSTEPLLHGLSEAPEWIRSWRRQHEDYMSQSPRPSSRDDLNPSSFEAGN